MNEPIQYHVTNAALADLKDKYSTIPDVTTKDGYEVVRIGIGELRTLRNDVEKHRKVLKADSLEWGRTVDAEAKRITTALTEIETPLITAKKIIDDAKEAEKQAKIKAEEEYKAKWMESIDRIRRQSLSVVGKSSVDIEPILMAVQEIEIEKYPEEYRALAESAKTDTITAVTEAMKSIRAQEAEAAEAKEKARIENERLEKERIRNERIQKEFEERERIAEAKRKEEQDKIDAENERIQKEKEAFEREKLEARLKKEAEEKAEKAAKEKAERDAETARIEAQKKADNAAYQAKIKKETIKSIMAIGINQGPADTLFASIKAGQIAHVRFVY